MTAAEHLVEAIAFGCTNSDHDHVGDHRREILASAEPIVVRRFDVSIEPALEDENPELLVCCVAEDGRPVALLLDAEARAKLAGLLGLGEGKGTGTTGGEPTPPSRFAATPLDVDVFLRQHFTEDVYLRYQQVIGNLSVAEAAKDARMDAALRQVEGEESMAEVIREIADFIDPRKSGGPHPARLLCSQHNGFGPCPGAPQCGPALPVEEPTFFEIGRAYRSEWGVFQCHAVTRHPMTGERRALGWQFADAEGVHQWVPAQLDPDDYLSGGWTATGGGR